MQHCERCGIPLQPVYAVATHNGVRPCVWCPLCAPDDAANDGHFYAFLNRQPTPATDEVNP